MLSRAGQTFSPNPKMTERSRRQQSTETRTRRTSITAYQRADSQSKLIKVKHESETTTEVAAQKAVESHNEVQKVVKGYSPRSTRSTSSKTTIPTM